MTDNSKDTSPEGNVSDEQLEDVAGGNSIHKRRIEQLETHDSSKNVKDINLQQTRLEELDARDK